MAEESFQSNDVFILGAGFSKAISCRMPLLNELSKALTRQRSGDLLQTVPFFKENIELALTYLSEGHPGLSEPERLRNRALFLELSEQVSNVLVRRSDEAQQERKEWLVPFAHFLHDRRSTIITLNYDTLLERAFSEIRVHLDGNLDPLNLLPFELATRRGVLAVSKTPTARLLKLHGSVSWYYSGSDSFYGEPIYGHHIPGKIPLILPPVAQKNTYFKNETVSAQWSLAREALTQARRIFCLGYSLPQTDLTFRFLLQSAVPPDATPFFVVDINESQGAIFRQRLPEFHDVRTEFCGGLDCISRLADSLTKEILVPGSLDDHSNFLSELQHCGCAAGTEVKAAGTDEVVSVAASDENGIVFRDKRSVLTRVTWNLFETALEALRQENGRMRLIHLDRILAKKVYRDVTRLIVTVLELLGRARYSVEYDTEYANLVEPN